MSRRNLLGLISLTLLGACEQGGNSAAPATTASLRPAGAPVSEYLLGPGDKIKIIVFNEEQLSGEFTVDPAGEISMPLIGRTRAAGQTAGALSTDLAARLRRTSVLRQPDVTVQILETRPFYVLGEVQRPGEFRYRPGLSGVGAVAMAGGFTFRANQRRVLVTRAGGQGEMRVDLAEGFNVEPGDVIRVPERLF